MEYGVGFATASFAVGSRVYASSNAWVKGSPCLKTTSVTSRTAPTFETRSRSSQRSILVASAAGEVQQSAPVAEAYDTTAFDDVVMKTYGRFPIALKDGSGATLNSTDGTTYLDCVAGIATCTLGHADPRIADAVSRQVRKLGHVSNLYYIPEQGQLAEWLVKNSPMDRVFFCNSGAEANEAAIKLVRKYWHQRNPDAGSGASPVILTAKNSFHGRTLATITATGQPKYHQGFAPLMPGFDYIEYNDVESLKSAAAKHGSNLAGIMLEALQGEGGVRPGNPEFFAEARRICDANDALLVFDEVQVGVGRTGKLWGFQNLDVTPDIFTSAKGLGGGVPIGAMLCKSKCDVFAPGDHASTFGGNPLAAAAGLAIANALDSDGVLQNCAERSAQLKAGLKKTIASYGSTFTEVRGWGLIVGVVIDENSPVMSIDVTKAAMASGLLVVPAGNKVVRFLPPLVITPAEVDSAISKFGQALSTLLD